MADSDTAMAPTVAIGYTHAPTFTWWLDENETTPELQFPQSVRVFDSMRRTDSQVTSVLQAVCLPVERTPWRIDPNGARDEVVQFVADDFGLPIAGQTEVRTPLRTKNRFSWNEHLRLALLMLPYGFSYFEQLYRVDDDGSRAHLAKLEFRPQMTIDRVEVATDGGLVYVQQCWTAQNSSPRPIPVDRLVAYVHRREGGNWLGQSILRPVYKNWLLKDRLLRVQAQTIERNGMGIPVYKGQEGATGDDLAAGKAMATAWRSGEAAGSAVPFGADIELKGVSGTLPDAKPAVEYHDTQIARAVLAHFLNLGTQTGSWALGSTFADFFTLSLQTLAQQIASTTTQHVIEDLVDVNWGPDEPAPRLCFDEIGSRQAATAEALKSLVDAGILHPDEPLEGATRQFYGLPPADPATATPPPGGAPTATPDAPTDTGEYSVAASRRRRSVRAKFNPGQLRDPHTGEWIDGTPDLDEEGFIEPLKLLAAGRGSGHHVASMVDPYGDYVESGGNPAHVIAVNLEQGGKAPWSRDDALDESAVFAAGDVDAVTAGMQDLAAKAVAFKPTPEQMAHAEEWGPIPIADGVFAGHKVAVFHDVHGDMGREGAKLLLVQSAKPREPNNDWHDAALDAPLDVLRVDARRIPGLVETMREMAAVKPDAAGAVAASAGVDLSDEASWIAAAAGVDTHPGGERLKRWWVYGAGAARWSTWTQLYDELKEHIKNVKKLKATVSAWYRLRYGHNPPRHHVAASALSGSDEALAAYAEEFGEPDFAELVDDEAADWELAIDALSAALDELSGAVAASFNPRQPRNPKGSPGAGRFRSMVDHLKDAIEAHREGGGKGHPFDSFDREQLRRVARKRGIELSRGESKDSIAAKLLGHLGGDEKPPQRAPVAGRVIRDSVARHANQSGWAGIADVRDDLAAAGITDRDQQDRALRDMLKEPDVRIVPIADIKKLTDRDREGALYFTKSRSNSEAGHAIKIGDPDFKPFVPPTLDQLQAELAARERSLRLDVDAGFPEEALAGQRKGIDELRQKIAQAGPVNPRAQRLADRQSKAGQKAAGVGVRKESPSRAARRKRIEDATTKALDELDRKS